MLRNLSLILYRRFILLEDIRRYGFLPTFKRVWMMREAWAEKGDKIMVGKDRYGNTYWTTEKATTPHRNRWVQLKGKSSQWMYDATAIPSEWHGWLHYSRDEPPTAEDETGTSAKTPQRLKAVHRTNPSGTRDQYFTPHHIFNPVHTNPDSKVFARVTRPSPVEIIREEKSKMGRDYNNVPLDELNEERPRYL